MALGALFRAERIKWRWNWSATLAFLAPFSQVLFLYLFFAFAEGPADPRGPGSPVWYRLNTNGWNLFFMPVAAALCAAISWDTEARDRLWKHLLIQPVPLVDHYRVKLLSHAALMVLAHAFLLLLLLAGAQLLRLGVPTLALGPLWPSLPLRAVALSLLASLPLAALHTWLPTRLPSLGANLGVALGGVWATSQLADTVPLLRLGPWGLATQVAQVLPGGTGFPWLAALGALACTILLVLLGTLDFRRRPERPT